MTEKSMHTYVLRGEGGKGGGGGRVAKEAPDSLHSTQWARIQDAINIGPTGGLYSGPGAEGRDVFLNGTPIIGEDGTVNWPDVEVHFRPGTQNQDPIPGFPGSESTTAVGFDLKFGTPWTQLITGDDYDAVRITLSTDRLTEQNTKNGDLNGYFIDYEIQRQLAGGAWESVMTSSMRGKATKRYTRTHRIELPLRTGPWNIRVRRTSPDSTGSHISSKLYVDAFTVVTDQRMRYPNIAMMGYKIPATLFSSIPVRAVRARGREIRVPSNYDARTRTYSGAWNGTFKLAVSSNPAWVWMDIVLSDIFGLGDRITINEIDRWSLYRIAQYCDELVPDGLGGMEPRFRAVGQIGSAQEAIKVLQDISTIFRGATFAGNGTVLTTADMPASPVYTYSRANVLGEFQYSSSGLSTRYTTAQVSYSNMDDFGRQKVEPVEDPAGIYRYGVRPTSTTAFLCVSRGQAHRMGKWTLLTSTEQTRPVTFKVGLDYAVVMPGSVIEIADNVLAGAMIGGRIASVEGANALTLDRRARVKPGDFLTVNMPSGLCETQRILSVAYGEETIQLTTTPFSEPPHAESGWSVSSDDLKPMHFRVTKVAQTGKMEVTISAVIERIGKHANVDYGTKLDPLPITIMPNLQMAPPTNLRVVNNTSTDQGAATNTLRAEWDGSKEARGYSVQWRRGNGDWIGLPDTTLESVEIPGIRTGVYQVRVQAFSALEVRSAWVVSDATSLEGTLEPPPVVSRLATTSRLYGIGVEWDFPETISPLRATEIYWSAAPDFTQATLLSEVSYPIRTLELPGLKAGTQFWFWARLVDSLGEKGDLYPMGEGVHGITLTDPIEYLEAIKDQVVGSEVGKQMLQDIEQLGRSIAEIDSDLVAQGQTMSEQAQKLIELTEELRLEAVARSQGDQANAMAISAESAERKIQADAAAAALGARIDALQAEVASLVGTPAWEDGKVYPEGFVVSWQGGLYRAKQQVPAGVDPRYSGYWDKIGNYDSLAEAVGDLTGRMATVEVVTAGNVQKLSQLEIVQGEQATAITDVQQVQAGQATRMATVEAKQGEQASKIQSLETVTADTAQILDNVVVQQGDMQSAISSLQTITANTTTRLDTLSTKVDGQASSISTLQSTQVGHAQRLTTLESTQADQASKIELLEDVQDGQALRMSTLETKQGQNSSKIQGLESTTANLASRTSTLETKQGEQASSITTIQQTQSNQATQINTLRTDVNGQASKISTLESTTAGLAQRSAQMEASIGQNTAGIRAEEQARAGADDALAIRINQMEAKIDAPFDTELAWNFDTSAEGWLVNNNNNGGITWHNEAPFYIRNTGKNTSGATLVSPADGRFDFDAVQNPILRVRIRFTDRSTQSTLFVTLYNTSNAVIASKRVPAGISTATNAGWQDIEVDLLADFSAELVGDNRTVRRMAIGNTNDAGAVTRTYELDYVAVGRRSVPLSRASLKREESARVSADEAITQRITRMEAEINDSYDTAVSWSFDQGAEIWRQYGGATVTWVNETPMYIRLSRTPGESSNNQRIDSGLIPVADRIDPSQYSVMRVRFRVAAGYSQSILPVFFAFNGGATVGPSVNVPIDPANQGWQTVDVDIAQYAGFSTATSISRIIIGSAIYGQTDFDYIALGRMGAPMSRALLQEEARARADGDGALSQTIETLRASTESDLGELDAAIRSEASARVSGDEANAANTTQLTARFNARPQGDSILPDPGYVLPAVYWTGSLVPFTISTRHSNGPPFPYIGQWESPPGTPGNAAGSLFMGYLPNQLIPVIGGQTYYLSGLMNANTAVSRGWANIYVQWFGPNNEVLARPAFASWYMTGSASQVHRFSASLVAPANAVSCYIVFYPVHADDADSRVVLRAFSIRELKMVQQSAADAENAANIVTEQTTRANADTALGTRIDQVTARVGNTETAVQTQANAIATLDGKVASNWNVRVSTNVNGIVHLAGMGVGVEANPNTGLMTSNIVMIADQLLLLHGKNGGYSAPFSVSGGQTFIADAYIRDASITSAKIGAAAITNAHLGNAIIGTVNIADGAITSTKIGYAQIHTANINIAQIDTLRLAGGSVTIGISDSFSWAFGRDWGVCDRYLQVYMPFGGTCIAFVQFDVDHGNATYPTSPAAAAGYVEAVGSDGAVFFQRPANDVVWTGSSPRYAWKGTGSYISPAYAAGHAWGFTARCARPGSGTMYVTGRMAIISFQR